MIHLLIVAIVIIAIIIVLIKTTSFTSSSSVHTNALTGQSFTPPTKESKRFSVFFMVKAEKQDCLMFESFAIIISILKFNFHNP